MKNILVLNSLFNQMNTIRIEKLLTMKGKTVIIIISLIRCAVATWLKSDFSYSAKINNGPKAPGAAENIEVFLSITREFLKVF